MSSTIPRRTSVDRPALVYRSSALRRGFVATCFAIQAACIAVIPSGDHWSGFWVTALSGSLAVAVLAVAVLIWAGYAIWLDQPGRTIRVRQVFRTRVVPFDAIEELYTVDRPLPLHVLPVLVVKFRDGRVWLTIVSGSPRDADGRSDLDDVVDRLTQQLSRPEGGACR